MKYELKPNEVYNEIANSEEGNRAATKFEMIASALRVVENGYSTADVVADQLAEALNNEYDLGI